MFMLQTSQADNKEKKKKTKKVRLLGMEFLVGQKIKLYAKLTWLASRNPKTWYWRHIFLFLLLECFMTRCRLCQVLCFFVQFA